MTDWVVDTNVLVVANAREINATIDCISNSQIFLKRVLDGEDKIVLDLDGAIESEYRNYCNPRGDPGLGDRFFLAILQSEPRKIRRVALERTAAGEYSNYPAHPDLANFDASDRKFVAAAMMSGAQIANSVDTDWLPVVQALQTHGLHVEFLCGECACAWFQS